MSLIPGSSDLLEILFIIFILGGKDYGASRFGSVAGCFGSGGVRSIKRPGYAEVNGVWQVGGGARSGRWREEEGVCLPCLRFAEKAIDNAVELLSDV